MALIDALSGQRIRMHLRGGLCRLLLKKISQDKQKKKAVMVPCGWQGEKEKRESEIDAESTAP